MRYPRLKYFEAPKRVLDLTKSYETGLKLAVLGAGFGIVIAALVVWQSEQHFASDINDPNNLRIGWGLALFFTLCGIGVLFMRDLNESQFFRKNAVYLYRRGVFRRRLSYSEIRALKLGLYSAFAIEEKSGKTWPVLIDSKRLEQARALIDHFRKLGLPVPTKYDMKLRFGWDPDTDQSDAPHRVGRDKIPPA